MSSAAIVAVPEPAEPDPEFFGIVPDVERPLLMPDELSAKELPEVQVEVSLYVDRAASNGLDVDVVEAISEVSIVESAEAETKKKLLAEIATKDYVDIPMLTDESTVDWISRNNVMVVMRGLPGSGKSTLVRNRLLSVRGELVADRFSGSGFEFCHLLFT